jgi:glycosyltransferase involved in cell wall biosynthesis
MKFSIIIPVYNVEQYLQDCLNSIVAQSYFDYEVICVNDGSTDGSLAILKEYEKNYSQITVITQSNKGLSGARNAGIRAAKGDYLFFLDSDDWIEPTALEVLSRQLSGEDMVCFNGRRVFENGKTEEPDAGISESSLSGWEYYNKYALVPRKFHFVCTVLRLYRREYLLKNNLFFEEGIYHEDNLFTPLACYYAQTVKVIPDCLYIYRIREGSITFDVSSRMKRIENTLKIANILSLFFIQTNSTVNRKVVFRSIAISIVHLFNMLHSWEMDDELDNIYMQVNLNAFRKIIIDLDIFVLYLLIKHKYWNVFYKIYYFDFYFCRRYFKKTTKYFRIYFVKF